MAGNLNQWVSKHVSGRINSVSDSGEDGDGVTLHSSSIFMELVWFDAILGGMVVWFGFE